MPRKFRMIVSTVRLALASVLLLPISCSTLPTPDNTVYHFPKADAFTGDVKRPHKVLGLVRAKVNFQTLDPSREESDLCQNYFNKAVKELVKYAQKKGGDAVIDVKSVVFLENGRYEMYPRAECADDGMEGQVLAQGIAVRWEEK